MGHFSFKGCRDQKDGIFPATSRLQVSQSGHPVNLFSSFLWKIGKPLSHGNTMLPAPGPPLCVLEGKGREVETGYTTIS